MWWAMPPKTIPSKPTQAGTRRRSSRLLSPSGMSGIALGGLAGAAVAGPLGAVVGMVVGGVAGEVLEHQLPSASEYGTRPHEP